MLLYKSCQPELVEGGFITKRASTLTHRLRQAQTDISTKHTLLNQ